VVHYTQLLFFNYFLFDTEVGGITIPENIGVYPSKQSNISEYISATSSLWEHRNYKYTANKIESTKQKRTQHQSDLLNRALSSTHNRMFVCVCVLWEVAGRAPFEGGTWNNVVIEIITVHTRKSALIEADGIGSGSCSSARFFIRVAQKSRWTLRCTLSFSQWGS